MKPGDHLEHKFGSYNWSISTEYIIRNENEINVNTTENGLVVDPNEQGERDPKTVHRTILTKDEINRAQIAVPFFKGVPGIVEVLSWRPSTR